MAFKLKHISYSPSAVWNYIFLAVFIILIGGYLIIMPKNADDYWFLMEGLDKWFLQQGLTDANAGGDIIKYGIPWEEIKATWSYHYNFDNARLGNILVPFFLLLPKWIGSGLCVAAWLFAMTGSFRLAKVNIRQSPLVPLAVFLWCFFMPWRNGMGCVVFQFNYLIPSALSVMLLYYLLVLYEKREHAFLIFIMAFLVGLWHEGFGLSIIVGLIAVLMRCRNLRNCDFILALIGLLVGVSILSVVPAMGVRCEKILNFAFNEVLQTIAYTVGLSSLYWIFLLLVIWVRVKKKIKKIFFDPIIIFSLASGIVTVCIMLVTYTESRVTWWAQFISVVGIMRVLDGYYLFWKRYTLKTAILGSVTSMFVIMHLGVVDYYAMRMNNALRRALHSYQSNKNQSVFEDVLTYEEMPLISLKTPDVLFYTISINWISAFVHSGSDDKMFMIIPDDLRFIDASSGRALLGDLGMREYEHHLFMPIDTPETNDICWREIEVDYGSGYKRKKVWMAPFRSLGDNRDYMAVYVFTNWFDQRFRTIKGIKNPE